MAISQIQSTDLGFEMLFRTDYLGLLSRFSLRESAYFYNLEVKKYFCKDHYKYVEFPRMEIFLNE